MAIALRGAAVVPAGNPTTSFTVVVPASVVAGDLLFLTVTSRDSTGAGTLAVTDNDTGGNAWAKIGNSTDHKATLWYKRATSGTASKTVTVSNAVGSASGVLKAFSGADGGATPYSDIAIETNASADETHAGFTPSAGDSMVCCSVHNYANDNAVTSLSFATLGATTMTEKLSTGGSDCACAFGHQIQSGAPVGTGNLTWAQTNGTTYSIVWAIKPAPAAVLTAVVGSFSFGGQAANLLQGYKLATEAGAFTHAGNAAGLLWEHKLTAVAGSFALAGNVATFYKSIPMSAGTGAFTFAGSAAGFVLGRKLTVEVGGFSLSGSAANFLNSRVLAAAVGAFNQVGQNAGLLVGKKLTAVAGSFALAGGDATLVHAAGAVLITSSGSFGFAGIAANFTRTYKLTGGVGVFGLTGSNANLITVRIPTPPRATPRRKLWNWGWAISPVELHRRY